MNQKAYYGEFGGQYVAESLMNTLEELDKAFEEAIHDPEFMKQYYYYLKQYVGRETPLYFAERLSERYGTKIYLKREDLNHTGAHKINNVIGQILLAKRMGKKKVIAETGAGQHGVATATGAALFDMECTVYMGEEDIKRQALNVMRMEMLGAKVVSVRSGSNTLKDATNEAIRTWAKTAEDTFYIIGSAVGPYPYPKMVKEFQSVISKEAKKQFLEVEHKLPDAVMACVGGGSNSIGMFADFIEEPSVKLIGVEAAGKGIETGEHASAMALGEPGVLHGMRSYLLQDEDGNVTVVHCTYDPATKGGNAPDGRKVKGTIHWVEASQAGKAEIRLYENIVDEEKGVYNKEDGSLNVELLGQGFTWLDTGTHESLVDATNFVKTVEQHQHRKIACLEEIAYLNGWISKDELMEVYEVMKKNQYGQYLKDVMDGKYQEHLY